MTATTADPLMERLVAVDRQVAELAGRDEFSGVIRVERAGELLLESAHGLASRRWGVPVRTTTRFDIASVTKLFTATAVLQQVAAGRLALEDRIHDHVDLAGTAIPEAVTLRQLLTHTSGIADDADEEAGESYEELWRDRPNYCVTATRDFLPQFAHKQPRVEPGTDCRYCNVGYILLGLAVEKATGRSYRDVVRSDVFERAGMAGAGFFDMRRAEPDVAEGWEPIRDDGDGEDEGPITGWRLNIYSYPPIGSPDGGAHASAADLTRFLGAVGDGTLLPPDLAQAFVTPQVLHHRREEAGPGETAEVHYAYGLEVQLTPEGEVRSYYKDGINVGSSAIVRHYPHQDVTLAVLSNSEDGAWDPINALDDAVTGCALP